MVTGPTGVGKCHIAFKRLRDRVAQTFPAAPGWRHAEIRPQGQWSHALGACIALCGVETLVEEDLQPQKKAHTDGSGQIVIHGLLLLLLVH